ncbi:hypothetical protein ACFVMC_29545 [Nocardia sp. NPDC127579]|uniref:hypothetical protein n=1 Tax=Nocardia sp. NPDC127579 TaxID=3345402 RepID=UPI00364319BB
MNRKRWPPPDYPLVEGEHMMTDSWSVRLPAQFCRRIEDGALVLWRPGVTAWTVVHGSGGRPLSDRLQRVKQIASTERFEEDEYRDGGLTYYRYRLRDANEDGDIDALYVFAFTETQHIQLAIYFDGPDDEVLARRIATGLIYTGPAEALESTITSYG